VAYAPEGSMAGSGVMTRSYGLDEYRGMRRASGPSLSGRAMLQQFVAFADQAGRELCHHRSRIGMGTQLASAQARRVGPKMGIARSLRTIHSIAGPRTTVPHSACSHRYQGPDP